MEDREKVLVGLRRILNEEIPLGDQERIDALSDAIDFIAEGDK